ncbi:MAG TPA: hypothetical protein VHL59_06545, partial [Thermoanaerobaculia bacterium]|nr:hypothetical protein [Thermoanaerobaculia bacterium]
MTGKNIVRKRSAVALTATIAATAALVFGNDRRVVEPEVAAPPIVAAAAVMLAAPAAPAVPVAPAVEPEVDEAAKLVRIDADERARLAT